MHPGGIVEEEARRAGVFGLKSKNVTNFAGIEINIDFVFLESSAQESPAVIINSLIQIQVIFSSLPL